MSRSDRSTARLLDRVQMTAADRARAHAALERADAIADVAYRLIEAVRTLVKRAGPRARRTKAA